MEKERENYDRVSNELELTFATERDVTVDQETRTLHGTRTKRQEKEETLERDEDEEQEQQPKLTSVTIDQRSTVGELLKKLQQQLIGNEVEKKSGKRTLINFPHELLLVVLFIL
jgi:hypothetical protein